ncbi:transcriptional adapter 2-alpha-like isoform X1 [Oratosquilla oratoria]|uniref:transcriptional adapter 2-alpha-like isoform X1 n=1 Tax=Oratosquilla oratoria TaxID=337810 RepID=UPI003F777A3C
MAQAAAAQEVVEEDATDLQFPKGLEMDSVSMKGGGFADPLQNATFSCHVCCRTVKEPYIECAQCSSSSGKKVVLCLQCFASGAERSTHRSNHSYAVVKNDFALLENSWKANDELKLLDAILQCGFGNWQDVSYRVEGKTEEECRNHYIKYYVEKPLDNTVCFRDRDASNIVHPQPITFVSGLDDPSRPTPRTNTSRDMAGYNAARGDFDVEYCQDAEQDIKDLDLKLFEDDGDISLGKQLQLAMIDIYRRKLGERFMRKRLVREHGLVAINRTASALGKHRSVLPSAFVDILPKLHQLFTSQELEMLVEGLSTESELKIHINDLQEYRRNGLAQQSHITLFEMLRKRHETYNKEKRNLVVSQGIGGNKKWDVLDKSTTSVGLIVPTSARRTSFPLNIVGKPGYEKLTNKEKTVASELRLYPEDFLRFKAIFIDECMKQNGLRLAYARTLLKIDVNKIRKLYDHLIQEGLIFAPLKA